MTVETAVADSDAMKHAPEDAEPAPSTSVGYIPPTNVGAFEIVGLPTGD
ncbi:MAG: hypothetical protein OXH19_02310 [Chloroflexi bacterium]|nr:hypothetical protein [Chloroflexota bacterium]MCY3587781.1 hypothetical protein [Chloroflexota bacterium]